MEAAKGTKFVLCHADERHLLNETLTLFFVCTLHLQKMLFVLPASTQRPQSCFMRSERKASLQLNSADFLCVLHAFAATVCCLPPSTRRQQSLCSTCQLCNGILKLFFVCSVGFAADTLREIVCGILCRCETYFQNFFRGIGDLETLVNSVADDP